MLSKYNWRWREPPSKLGIFDMASRPTLRAGQGKIRKLLLETVEGPDQVGGDKISQRGGFLYTAIRCI